MHSVLVTGGAGFIGSHIVDQLVKDHQVIVLDDLSGGFRENVNSEALFVPGSINNLNILEALFNRYKFKYVYHLAAYAAENLSHYIKRFNYDNNLMGSINLINLSVNHGVKCFIFTSSIAVYGDAPAPFREDSPTVPEDSYGVAKLSVEHELRICKRMFDMDYLIFRPHNVYGERQNIGDRYRNVVGIFMNQILKGEPLTIFGDGEQKRAFTYIKDIDWIIASSPEVVRNEVFNIGSDSVCTVNELSKDVMILMGKAKVNYLPERKESKFAFCDHSNLRKYFSHKEHTLKVGLENMADWVKDHGSRESLIFKNIEIEKNFVKGW